MLSVEQPVPDWLNIVTSVDSNFLTRSVLPYTRSHATIDAKNLSVVSSEKGHKCHTYQEYVYMLRKFTLSLDDAPVRK